MNLDKRKQPVSWENLSDQERSSFTMGGLIQVAPHWCIGDISFSQEPTHHGLQQIEEYRQRIQNKGTASYEDADTYLYQALKKFKIKGQQVAIFGSTKPWYEAFCMEYGGYPTTIEYNQVTTDHPDLETMTVAGLDQSPRVFDSGFSISSFEHDGLGRYGDPINPYGDIETMQKTKRVIKKGGLLFLAIPVGKDKLCFNAHRVYGHTRLPLMLAGWLAGWLGASKIFWLSGKIPGNRLWQQLGASTHICAAQYLVQAGFPEPPSFTISNLCLPHH